MCCQLATQQLCWGPSDELSPYLLVMVVILLTFITTQYMYMCMPVCLHMCGLFSCVCLVVCMSVCLSVCRTVLVYSGHASVRCWRVLSSRLISEISHQLCSSLSVLIVSRKWLLFTVLYCIVYHNCTQFVYTVGMCILIQILIRTLQGTDYNEICHGHRMNTNTQVQIMK